MDNRNKRNTNNNNDNKKQNRQKRTYQSNRPKQQRKRRVTVDRDVEVVIVSNVLGEFYYENPRMSMVIDLQHINDEEYITVGDLRAMLNSNRKILEGFDILITEVLDSNYTLDDVLLFLGLDKKYDEYYSLTGKKKGSMVEVKDIEEFLTQAPLSSFKNTLENGDARLRSKIIENSVTLFKLGKFSDFNKMKVIQNYVSDEIFLDADETEVDGDIYI